MLNVTEDHMDRYVDLEDYRQSKINADLPQMQKSAGSEFRKIKLTFGER